MSFKLAPEIFGVFPTEQSMQIYVLAQLGTTQRGISTVEASAGFTLKNKQNEEQIITLEEDKEESVFSVSYPVLISVLVVGVLVIVAAVTTIGYYGWRYQHRFRGHQLLAE